ncbi:39S ribosomal protein L47, mitochondrial [Lutzomyia longipalpis]|uniref:39S ribosomal protein L47, mitochondrial n=1 Tax=Lutzomyia longipalpis TaxID=7200 RepID=UPI002483C66B|nr:39S ribosomal protein L47, mitochondrial [Lutzomyia longipalpis]
MGSFVRVLGCSRLISRIPGRAVKRSIQSPQVCLGFHTSSTNRDLMEFFDDKKNWGELEVKTGRAWTKDELRIKSNADLHKLWYVLLKERNMLMTMEHECNEQIEPFPSPERVDKVKISMENLEMVIRERNRAYHQLETGETGERPSRVITDVLGLEKEVQLNEYVVPKTEADEKVVERVEKDTKRFLLLLNEQKTIARTRERQRNRNEVMHLLRRFPHLDKKMLAEKYPDVDIDKLLEKDMCRGHYVPNSQNSN